MLFEQNNSVMIQYNSASLNEFSKFLRIDQQLADRTVKDHKNLLTRFLERYDGETITRRDLQEYLSKFSNKNTYRNNLSTFKIYFRDYMRMPHMVDGFRFPKATFSPKSIPTKEELATVYNAIDNLLEKVIFIFFASSGLRRHELLDMSFNEVDFNKRMLAPKSHGMTKLTWISFYNEEANRLLAEYLKTRPKNCKRLFPHAELKLKKIWNSARNKTKLNITPQVLREWFAEEMANCGVSDRYIDAFCGRIPRSVLARHYTDYRPDKLKAIYDKANIKVLS